MASPPASWLSRFADIRAIPGIAVRLAGARLALRNLGPSDISARNSRVGGKVPDERLGQAAAARAARMVPWVAARVPWRSDCLVQAIAAQGWLASRGVSSTIELGVDRLGSGIEPHAWLRAGDTVVTGGPVDRFTVLLAGKGT